ncbi:UPF0739 protein C1orf74 homolog [Dreissena polymorpha]|nr:UPF0739 protein C1orf74 homolog [Dreissena polymorpha]
MTVSDSSNVSSLFGVLLDYPLVYWYDVSEGNCSDTCLNMVDLTVVSVRTTLECCVVQDDAKEVRQSFDKQVLYQFSYPSALKGHCEQVVVRWKEKLADKLRCSSDVKQFEFESQNVCMESVVL